MGISCSFADGSEEVLAEARGGTVGEAETLLIVLARPASGKLRKLHGLPAKALVAASIAKAAGVPLAVLEPLLRHSTGIYTEDDYLALYAEDWEREEYGTHAAEVVASNRAD